MRGRREQGTLGKGQGTGDRGQGMGKLFGRVGLGKPLPTESNAPDSRFRFRFPTEIPLFSPVPCPLSPVPFFLLLLILLLVATTPLAAQNSTDEGLPPNIIERDIGTSTLSELAAWSRRLGLPEGGTSADLARRLREHYGLPAGGGEVGTGEAPADGRRIITIESARTTEYFTIQAVDEEYARLSGEVVISLRDGDALHEIRAWDILFNRTRNILSASGGVEYRKTQGDSIETFRGDSITVDLDNWSSIFLGGISERARQDDGTTYLFAGTVISRDEEEATVLKNATISTTGGESLWSLTASRVWLLPGSDFAILNAVLKVGHVPVFYIPAFFFPADKMIFHPAIGSRTREGNFVNTTTFILGRPKNVGGTESSLTSIMGAGGDMERRREGLFLRSTGVRVRDSGGPSLSILADWYTNLGGYFGAEMTLPGGGVFGASSLSAGVGLTRTLAPPSGGTGGAYTPFWPNFDGEVDWNNSKLFGTDVPFRYRLETDGSASGKPGSVSWRMQHYSDPFINGDFMENRATDMDWMNMIQQGAAGAEVQTSSSQSQSAAPIWEVRGSVAQPRLPGLSPYISGLSIDQMSSSLSFSSRESTTDEWRGQNNIKVHSPMRFFFFPSTSNLYTAGFSVNGTLLNFGAASASASTAAEPPENRLEGIGVPISPFDTPDEGEPPVPRDPSDTLVPPALAQRFDSTRTSGNTTFSLTYRLAPSSLSTLRFDSGQWSQFDDVEWGQVESVLTQFAGSGNVATNFALPGNLLTNTFTLSGTGTWRQFSFLDEEAGEFTLGSGGSTVSQEETDRRLAQRRLNEYRQSGFRTTYVVDTAIRPLHLNPIFGQSSFQHTLGGLAVRSEFASTVDDLLAGEGPKWDLLWGEWDKEKIDRHQLTGRVAASVMDRSQSMSVTAILPPLEERYNMNASISAWITSTSASWGIRFPENEDPKHDPFNLTHSWTFPAGFGNLSQNLRMDTEEVHLTSLSSTLNLATWGLNVAFRAERIVGREFVKDGEWGQWQDRTDEDGNKLEPSMMPRDLRISHRKRVDLSPNGGIVRGFFIDVNSATFFDLQEFTNSNFTFSVATRLDMKDFSLRLGASSVNNEIFRYFRNLPGFRDADIPLPDGEGFTNQNNILLDLINSFRFDRRDLREISGFKIQSFTIGAERSFGDWNATLDWSMRPHRPPGERSFQMGNVVSFAVRWVPISEFRSDIRYDGTVQPNNPKWNVQGL